MDKKIAFCGIDCSECEAYIATQNNDDEVIKELAKKWSVEFQSEIEPSDIYCDGCTSNGPRLMSYCNVCNVRLCGIDKEVENCAYCVDYACPTLEDHFSMSSICKEKLDEIRKDIGK